MNDLCDDNRFELIEKYKKELIDATNIETAPDEMAVLDDILFRFWQMGWLDSVDRMPLVKESARTLMHSAGNSISAKAFRNAGRFVQNAIDGEPPEFEKLLSAQPSNGACWGCQCEKVEKLQPEREKGKWIPCSERLPEKYGNYLVTTDDGESSYRRS